MDGVLADILMERTCSQAKVRAHVAKVRAATTGRQGQHLEGGLAIEKMAIFADGNIADDKNEDGKN